MIIANPIYDVAFKKLLENDSTAKFLIGTILDCKVLSLEQQPIEKTKHDESGRLTLFRKDFSATIKTKEGEKRVIIEMQKAKKLGDIARFRDYLGSEYTKSKLPIIAIYILGFNLKVNSPAFMARPDCFDLMTKQKIDGKDHFVEHLTHHAYFIQTLQIKPAFNTRLEKLLAIFEQDKFIDDKTTTKMFPFDVKDKDIKEMLDVLRYAAADAETRKELDLENEYLKSIDEIFGEKDAKIAEQAEQLAQKDEELAKERAEKAQQAAEIAELKRLLSEKKE